MALRSSGPIALVNDIANEFGYSLPADGAVSIGNYRVSENYGEMYNVPLDRGIPKPTTENPSPTIKFSDFYDKRLNMVVNFYNIALGGTTDVAIQQNMKVRFETTEVKVVGGFLSPTSTTGGSVQQLENHKRVIVNVSKIIARKTAHAYSVTETYDLKEPERQRNEISMMTGDWDPNTKLDLFVGPSGFIVGAGGAGGKNGHSRGGDNGPGDRGTSALGVTYPLEIYNYGTIAGGGGGGGGSPYAFISDRRRSPRTFLGIVLSRGRRRQDRKTDGSAGGGGAGYPAGPPGEARANGNVAEAGNVPPITTGGAGGASNGRASVAGGKGGDLGQAGATVGSKGTGGTAGHGIIISGSGTAAVIEGNSVLDIVNGEFKDFT